MMRSAAGSLSSLMSVLEPPKGRPEEQDKLPSRKDTLRKVVRTARFGKAADRSPPKPAPSAERAPQQPAGLTFLKALVPHSRQVQCRPSSDSKMQTPPVGTLISCVAQKLS